MAVKIKLKRMGKIRAPYYRIVVADSRTKRDGRAIEELGRYHPTQEPSLIEVDSERVQYWLSVGAQPTEPVAALLRVTGDWQRFKGLPGAQGSLRVGEPRPDKKAAFDQAAREAMAEPKEGVTTPRGRDATRAGRPETRPAGSEPAPAAGAVDTAAGGTAAGDTAAGGSAGGSAGDTAGGDTAGGDTAAAGPPDTPAESSEA